MSQFRKTYQIEVKNKRKKKGNIDEHEMNLFGKKVPFSSTTRTSKKDKKNSGDSSLRPKPTLNMKGYEVTRVPMKNAEIPQTRGMMDGVITSHPGRTLVVGGSGSGKTNACIFSLLNTDLYGGYFDEVYMFAATSGSDPLFESLGLPEECVFSDDFINNVRTLFDFIKEDVEDMDEAEKPKRLVIFEDISCEMKLLRSQELKEAFTQSRHYGVSIMAITHAYKVVPPVCRESSERLWLYPLNAEELDKVAEAWTPPSMSKKEFSKFIKDTFSSFPDIKKPFMQIDRTKKKFFMGFNIGLEWSPV